MLANRGRTRISLTLGELIKALSSSPFLEALAVVSGSPYRSCMQAGTMSPLQEVGTAARLEKLLLIFVFIVVAIVLERC